MNTPPNSLSLYLVYAARDAAFGQQVAQDLTNWLHGRGSLVTERVDDPLPHTADWSHTQQAITASTIFLIIVSPASMASPWINAELDLVWHQRATGNNRIILPLRYRATEVREDLELVQIVSFLPPRSYADGMREIVTIIDTAMQHPDSVQDQEYITHTLKQEVISPKPRQIVLNLPVISPAQRRALLTATISFLLLVTLLAVYSWRMATDKAEAERLASAHATATSLSSQKTAIIVLTQLPVTQTGVAATSTAVAKATTTTKVRLPYQASIPGPCTTDQVADWSVSGTFVNTTKVCQSTGFLLANNTDQTDINVSSLIFTGRNAYNGALPYKHEYSLSFKNLDGFLSVNDFVLNVTVDSDGYLTIQNPTSTAPPVFVNYTNNQVNTLKVHIDASEAYIIINNNRIYDQPISSVFTSISSIQFNIGKPVLAGSPPPPSSVQLSNFSFTPLP